MLPIFERARPSNLVLTTFTDNAAAELRDRITRYARLCGYKGPLYEMRIGTIHSLCNEIIRKWAPHLALKRNYEILDGLTQHLFLHEKFTEIVTEQMKINNSYFGRWWSKDDVILGLIPYFNRISEELIDLQKLLNSNNKFLSMIAQAYKNYTISMYANNRIDFAHQQKIVCDLLQRHEMRDKITSDINYVMVGLLD